MLAKSSKLSFIGQVLIAVATGAVIASGPAQAWSASNSWRGAVGLGRSAVHWYEKQPFWARYGMEQEVHKVLDRWKHCRELPTTTFPPWSWPRTSQCARFVTTGHSPYIYSGWTGF
jgi:hypothetical protein